MTEEACGAHTINTVGLSGSQGLVELARWWEIWMGRGYRFCSGQPWIQLTVQRVREAVRIRRKIVEMI